MTVKHAILNAIILLAIVALPLQILIDPSIVNIASACIVLASSLSLLIYLKWGGPMDDQPLSTVAILGFCVTTQLGALLVQTLAWTSLITSLYDPLLTFTTLALYQAIAIAMHIGYRFFTAGEARPVGVFRGLLGWAGLYQLPSSGALWIMGCIGLASFVASSRMGILARIGGGFNFLTWAPFLIPICLKEVGPSYCNAKLNNTLLLGFTAMVALMALALNVRAIMFTGVITIALLYAVIGMRSDAPVTKRALVRLGVLAAALLAISGPVSSLATSMAIARGSRGKVPPVEMIRRTIAVWRRPALRDAYKNELTTASLYAVYDEHYIANPVLARFVETKFHDNALHFAGLLKSEDSKQRLRAVTSDFLWSTLPTPILEALGVNVDKDDLAFSMGDYLAYLSRGVPLGGRKTGSMFAQGQVVLGPLFPFVYALACVVMYGLMGLMTVRVRGIKPSLSVLAMMSLWIWFYRGITSEALSNIFIVIVRDFEQALLIYLLVFAVARMMLPRTKSLRGRSVLPGWQRAV